MFARLGLPAPPWVPATAAEFFDARMRRFEISSKEPYAWFVTRGPGEGTLDTTLLSGRSRPGPRSASARGSRPRRRPRRDGTPDARRPRPRDCVRDGRHHPRPRPLRSLGRARRVRLPLHGRRPRDVRLRDRSRPRGDRPLLREGEGEAPLRRRRPDGGAARRLLLHEFRPRPRPEPRRTARGGGGGGVPGLPLRPRHALRDRLRRPRGRGAPRGRRLPGARTRAVRRRQRVSLVNRFLYEAGGAFGLSLFARLAARADFRSVLSAFYRPGPVRLALAPLVAALWRNRGRCAHRLPPHWCRAREREIREVALGRIG